MKLYYYRNPAGQNFGDDLNPWLWPRLLGDLLDEDESQLLIGIGTILDRRIPPALRKVVFGSGIGYGRMPRLDHTWRIICVRGPLTAAALGLADDLAITDPALLVRDLVPPSPGKADRASFMPHHKTVPALARDGLNLEAICAEIGFNYIDPGDSIEDILVAIRDSEWLVAEAMHGAIVADALRVPWIPVQLSDQISNFKWWDWCRSLKMDYRPQVFGRDDNGGADRQLIGFFRHLLTNVPRQLSDEAVTATLAARLRERVQRLQEAYAQPGSDDDRLLSDGMSGTRWTRNLEVLRIDPALYDLHEAAEQIESLATSGTPLVVVDQEWVRGALDEACRAMPFLERDGQYWGLPPDDETAIDELERLRREGAKLLIVAWPAFWWLKHYANFGRYLETRFDCIFRNDRMAVFDLLGERTGPWKEPG